MCSNTRDDPLVTQVDPANYYLLPLQLIGTLWENVLMFYFSLNVHPNSVEMCCWFFWLYHSVFISWSCSLVKLILFSLLHLFVYEFMSGWAYRFSFHLVGYITLLYLLFILMLILSQKGPWETLQTASCSFFDMFHHFLILPYTSAARFSKLVLYFPC